MAIAAALAGTVLAAQHPLAPLPATLAFVGWTVLAAAMPSLWLFAVPALLPLASLAPWTGWIAFDEFDLLLLGALAGGHARRAVEARTGVPGGAPAGAAQGTGRMPLLVVPGDQSAPGSLAVPSSALWSWPSPALAVALAIAVWTVAGAVRGLLAAGLWPDVAAPFHGYTDPLNALRVAKAPLYALLAAPLVRRALDRSRQQVLGLVAAGMLAGTAAFALAVLGERATYPGVFDASDDYRATALFWEMHVGGAAIDAYCVLALPFAAWAVRRARTPGAWAGAAALALLAEYAWLVTYARGAFGAVLVGLAVAAWLLRRETGVGRATDRGVDMAVRSTCTGSAQAHAGRGTQPAVRGRTLPDRPRWRRRADALLIAALLAQAGWMLFGGSAIRERLGQGPLDLGSRIAHWRHGLGLLHAPADAAFGLGLGRLPAAYARDDAARELPGAVRWRAPAMHPATATTADRKRTEQDAPTGPASAPSDAPTKAALPAPTPGADPLPGTATGVDPHLGSTTAPAIELAGPARAERLGGRFMLTQRVTLDAGAHGDWRLQLVLHADRPVRLRARVCTRHLLYEWDCRAAVLAPVPGTGWQRVEARLDGPPLDPGPRFAPRQGEFSLAVTTAGGAVALRSVSLAGPDGAERLANGDFAAGPARWWPLAGHYFLPWHIDSLYAETLIERGAVGLALLAAAFALAARGLLRRPSSMELEGEGGKDVTPAARAATAAGIAVTEDAAIGAGAGAGTGATPAAAAAANPSAAAAVDATADRDDDLGLRPFLAASLAGAAALGAVSSLLDMPRTAFLFAFFLVLAVQMFSPRRERGQAGSVGGAAS